ncbi:MAG: DHHA1 domain-containing protein [Acidobacteria bacterium]|nr:DHHA1 domain-containing protein [Acidobacteriota bacterium]
MADDFRDRSRRHRDNRAVKKTSLGRDAVTLDRTAFYPAGGGQPCDTGTLGGARVVECVDEEERGVLHVVEGDVPAVGAQIHGRVDWARRLDHMQQHTGQHILSQAFVELFGAQTRGFRMMSEASEIDLELEDATDVYVERAVDRANEIIWEDRAVRVHQVSAEQAAAMPLRRDSAREGELRVIEIEGFDMSPCGGTHAARTGEVGVIAVRSWERAKRMTRVEFVAGGRALADYRRANHTARGVAILFSAGRDEAVAAVARLLGEHKQQQRRVRALEEIEARTEADELLKAALESGPRVFDGTLIVARTFEGRDSESLKRLALSLVSRTRTVALLGSLDGDDTRLVFARSTDAGGDMNALMREACALVEGRGGGRTDIAQGGGHCDAERLGETVRAMARKLTG